MSLSAATLTKLENNRQPVALISFDVFDTVLTRSCGAPEGLFLWLGRRLVSRGLLPCSAEVFARARMRADKHVWRRAGGLDSPVSVVDFQREVVRWLALAPELATAFEQAELELEAEVLRATPDAVKVLGQKFASERRIAFVTDTYFSRPFIEDQLKMRSCWPENAVCYASSDHEAAKASGRLFKILLGREGLTASQILHIGDNAHSDNRMPQAQGIATLPAPRCHLNRYEMLLMNDMWATAGLSAAFAGASRLARISVPAANEHEQCIRDVTAGVAAPILVGYALWLLHRAQTLGLNRLCFLSRDGQVLHQITRQLADRLKSPIVISYLHVSRRVTNLASTFQVDDEEIAWIFRDAQNLTYENFMGRFGITWTEACESMARAGFMQPAGRVTQGDYPRLRDVVTTAPMVSLVKQKAAAKREIILQYLRQENVLTENPVGLIDFGGVGSQIRALHALISKAGAPAPKLFVMGLDTVEGLERDTGLRMPRAPEWLNDTECYLYDHRRKLGIKRARGFGTCVQIFCAADHGTVAGFSDENGRLTPQHAPEVDEPVAAWGLCTMRDTLSSFVSHLTLDPTLVDLNGDMRDPACDVINTFWTSPTFLEAKTWGSFPFEGAEAVGNKARPLAWRYAWSEVATGLIRRKFPNLGWQHWYEGSLALSAKPLRLCLQRLGEIYYQPPMRSGRIASTLRTLIRKLLRK